MCASSGYSQLTFNKKRDTCILENGVEQKAKITIYNNSSMDYGVSWRTISSSLLDNDGSGNHWKIQFCECNLCHTNEFNALPGNGTCDNSMTPGSSKEWYLTVDPDGQPMINAEYVVEVTNTTTRERDTITYVVLSPNSVIELDNFGKLSTFPNPVNEKLNIQYELVNVNQPQLTVYNILGVEVETLRISNLTGNSTVNTSQYAEGIYIYVLSANNKQLSTGRFNVVH